jgi:hypothetical protein
MRKIRYIETFEFQKDFKKLLKRYISLKNDFELVKEASIELYHIHKIDNISVFLIPGFCSENIKICKIKKFSCDALKNRGSKSGIRIIYAFHCFGMKVVFLEMYYKGNQEKEDFERIKAYLKGQKKD